MTWYEKRESLIVPTVVGLLTGSLVYWFVADLLLVGSAAIVWAMMAWIVVNVKQRSPDSFFSLEGQREWWAVTAFGIAILTILQGIRTIPVSIEYQFSIQIHSLGIFALGYYIAFLSGLDRGRGKTAEN